MTQAQGGRTREIQEQFGQKLIVDYQKNEAIKVCIA